MRRAETEIAPINGLILNICLMKKKYLAITHLITAALKAEVHAINLPAPNVATAQQWTIYAQTNGRARSRMRDSADEK